jgi:hypothetical protein
MSKTVSVMSIRPEFIVVFVYHQAPFKRSDFSLFRYGIRLRGAALHPGRSYSLNDHVVPWDFLTGRDVTRSAVNPMGIDSKVRTFGKSL